CHRGRSGQQTPKLMLDPTRQNLADHALEGSGRFARHHLLGNDHAGLLHLYRKSVRPDTLHDVTVEDHALAVRKTSAFHEGGREYLPLAERPRAHALPRFSRIEIFERHVTA